MLTEQKILAEVSIQHDSQTIAVRWQNEILRDGKVISSIPHRRCYGKIEKDDFIKDVENAEQYIQLANW